MNLLPFTGINQFGPAYETMLENDTHAAGSVDRVMTRDMVRLCPDTAAYLYDGYTPAKVSYVGGTRPELETLIDDLPGDSVAVDGLVASIARFTSGLRKNVAEETLDEMRFGGTEEEIIQRGSDWCTDVARVACVLCQIAGVPARLAMLFDTDEAYSGHVIIEAFREGAWGAVDASSAIVYRHADGRPATTWDLMTNPGLFELARRPDGRMPANANKEQFNAGAISNYQAYDRERYDYSISPINGYYRTILENADKGWPDGFASPLQPPPSKLRFREAASPCIFERQETEERGTGEEDRKQRTEEPQSGVMKPMGITKAEIEAYRENGYHIIRGVLSADEASAYREHVREEVKRDAFPSKLKYPEPAKYTVSGNRMADPGMAPIIEHPVIVDTVETLLGQPAHLTAFVAYLRSPGDTGGGAHCDYKRWRPVGSSMNWLFAIIPLNDFDAEFGPLMVAPGSHKLESVIDPASHILDVTAPDRDQMSDFIDPDLKAGDVLLMNGRTWHLPPAGATKEDRVGFFNKYCAVNAPPAAGYYPYNQEAHDALSDEGKRLIPVHFDKPISATQLLIEDTTEDESRFFVMKGSDGEWGLPGGEGEEEESAGWDVGSRIASVQTHVQAQLGIDVPWVSYIEDVENDDGVCRVYGYSDGEGSLAALGKEEAGDWFTQAQLADTLGEEDDITRAARTWRHEGIIRGMGKPNHQSKQQFD